MYSLRVWNRISFFPTPKIYSRWYFFYRRRKSRSLITRKKISNFFSESVHLSKKVLCNFLFAHHFRQSDSLNLINQPSESIRCLLRSNIARIETTLAELFDSIDHEKLATTRSNFILYRGSTLSYSSINRPNKMKQNLLWLLYEKFIRTWNLLLNNILKQTSFWLRTVKINNNNDSNHQF